MAYQKKTQSRLPPSKGKSHASEPSSGSSIVETESWINAKGKAVYVNIAEADIDVKDGRVSFITSVSNLKRLVDGEIGGVKLGRFEN